MSDPIRIDVGPNEGKVVLYCSMMSETLDFAPQNALEFSKKMAECAKDLGARDEPTIIVAKERFNPLKDAALVTRLGKILADMLERGKSPEYIAREFIFRVREKSE